ncbi:hypothetical protein AC578_838 [Pseudocercospora eumusae]|uniref:Uncharacterized protein n=1 Tax=Pseudocercospora eumusae TaxID=321146 RepID=A0A139GZR3_9PEZI|nr:hypothetical protein AC578_838 [Pseudocercospora eumusae]
MPATEFARLADGVPLGVPRGMTYTAATRTAEMQKRIVQAYSRLLPLLAPMFEKKGVAGTVRTPARKSRDHPFPPVADAEYGP